MHMLPFRKKPAPAAEEPPKPVTLQERLIAIIEVNLIRFPFVQPLRILWRDLQSERASWPFLLPLLAFIGWRTYRAERQKMRK
jgi:hypothetical protein